MIRESDFIEAINAAPDDRTIQLIYADWLDERDDPRGMAWRVLIEAGKRPKRTSYPWRDGKCWDWYPASTLDPDSVHDLDENLWGHVTSAYLTFFEALDDAAIAWVRANYDSDFRMWEICDFCNGSGQSFAVDGVEVIDGKTVGINPRPVPCMCCDGKGRCKVGEQLPPGQIL